MILFFGLACSVLPGSFPIEVAWVEETGQAESYLTRPHEEWLEDRAGTGDGATRAPPSMASASRR